MSDNDANMRWKIKKMFISWRDFLGYDNDGAADTSLSQGTPTAEPSSGPSELETVPMTTADELHTLIKIPWDLCKSHKVAGRVLFIHASTDASDAPVFKLGTKFLGKQAAVPELQGGADVTVTITHDGTVATDDSLEIAPWTDLQWDQYIDDDDVLAGLALELDALGSATADECELLGIELAYVVEMRTYEARINPIDTLIADNPAF